MVTLLNELYYKLRKEEIEKAHIILKMIKVETILQSLTKLCWKYNIQYEVIIKTKDTLTIKLRGNREIVVFKYHKADMVLRENIDSFLSELDKNKAHKGIYLTTGKFEKLSGLKNRVLVLSRDCMLEDSFSFIKRHLGLKGRVLVKFKEDNLDFFKYLPQ